MVEITIVPLIMWTVVTKIRHYKVIFSEENWIAEKYAITANVKRKRKKKIIAFNQTWNIQM